MIAADGGNVAVVSKLLTHGAAVALRDKKGKDVRPRPSPRALRTQPARAQTARSSCEQIVRAASPSALWR